MLHLCLEEEIISGYSSLHSLHHVHVGYKTRHQKQSPAQSLGGAPVGQDLVRARERRHEAIGDEGPRLLHPPVAAAGGVFQVVDEGGRRAQRRPAGHRVALDQRVGVGDLGFGHTVVSEIEACRIC
jgi:hypothetical protein